MTQWLIEEAAAVALDIDEMRLRHEASEEERAQELLLQRHAELTAMKEQAHGVR